MSGNMMKNGKKKIESGAGASRLPVPTTTTGGTGPARETSEGGMEDILSKIEFLTLSERRSVSSENEIVGCDDEMESDEDVWSTRIILSALEDIFFRKPSSIPTLSPSVIHAFQQFLLSVHSSVANCNEFVEIKKSDAKGRGSMSMSESHSRSAPAQSDFQVEKGVMEVLESLSEENKIVIRSLVSSYIQNLPNRIMELWGPLLEADGIPLPTVPVTSKLGAKSTHEGGVDKVAESLEVILNQMKKHQQESDDMDVKIALLMKTRDEEKKKLDLDTDRLKRLTEEILKEESLQLEPDYVKAVEEYNKLEKKCLLEQIKLEELKLEAETIGSEAEQEEMNELYNAVKTEYEKLEAETKEMEEKLAKYKSLGSDYTSYLTEYKELEEQIKTKEWVKEQLLKGPTDDSLFDDSFLENL